jgi:hypothetical protein
VQVLQHENNLGSVEPGNLLVEPAIFPKITENLAAGDIVEEEIQTVSVGKRSLKIGDEGMACHICEHGSFVAYMVDLFQLDNLCLFENLESVYFCVLVLFQRLGGASRADETHSGKCPYTEKKIIYLVSLFDEIRPVLAVGEGRFRNEQGETNLFPESAPA